MARNRTRNRASRVRVPSPVVQNREQKDLDQMNQQARGPSKITDVLRGGPRQNEFTEKPRPASMSQVLTAPPPVSPIAPKPVSVQPGQQAFGFGKPEPPPFVRDPVTGELVPRDQPGQPGQPSQPPAPQGPIPVDVSGLGSVTFPPTLGQAERDNAIGVLQALAPSIPQGLESNPFVARALERFKRMAQQWAQSPIVNNTAYNDLLNAQAQLELEIRMAMEEPELRSRFENLAERFSSQQLGSARRRLEQQLGQRGLSFSGAEQAANIALEAAGAQQLAQSLAEAETQLFSMQQDKRFKFEQVEFESVQRLLQDFRNFDLQKQLQAFMDSLKEAPGIWENILGLAGAALGGGLSLFGGGKNG